MVCTVRTFSAFGAIWWYICPRNSTLRFAVRGRDLEVQSINILGKNQSKYDTVIQKSRVKNLIWERSDHLLILILFTTVKTFYRRVFHGLYQVRQPTTYIEGCPRRRKSFYRPHHPLLNENKFAFSYYHIKYQIRNNHNRISWHT